MLRTTRTRSNKGTRRLKPYQIKSQRLTMNHSIRIKRENQKKKKFAKQKKKKEQKRKDLTLMISSVNYKVSKEEVWQVHRIGYLTSKSLRLKEEDESKEE